MAELHTRQTKPNPAFLAGPVDACAGTCTRVGGGARTSEGSVCGGMETRKIIRLIG